MELKGLVERMGKVLVLILTLAVLATQVWAGDINTERSARWREFQSEQKMEFRHLSVIPIPHKEAVRLLYKKYGLKPGESLNPSIPEIATDENRCWYMLWHIGSGTDQWRGTDVVVGIHLNRGCEWRPSSETLGDDWDYPIKTKLTLFARILGIRSLLEEPFREALKKQVIRNLIINPWRAGRECNETTACMLRYHLNFGLRVEEYGLSEAELAKLKLQEPGPRACCGESVGCH